MDAIDNSVICVPIYQRDSQNVVKPNPIFHRSVDRLRSRCIEYPYVAAMLDVQKSSKSLMSARQNQVMRGLDGSKVLTVMFLPQIMIRRLNLSKKSSFINAM